MKFRNFRVHKVDWNIAHSLMYCVWLLLPYCGRGELLLLGPYVAPKASNICSSPLQKKPVSTPCHSAASIKTLIFELKDIEFVP